jgi:hypothetical protein
LLGFLVIAQRDGQQDASADQNQHSEKKKPGDEDAATGAVACSSGGVAKGIAAMRALHGSLIRDSVMATRTTLVDHRHEYALHERSLGGNDSEGSSSPLYPTVSSSHKKKRQYADVLVWRGFVKLVVT